MLRQPTPAPKPPEPVHYGPLNILVVDDDDGSRQGLAKAIVQLGHHCRTARDGVEAWEILQQERADVVLSDWRMPRMDGVELCRRTRSTDSDASYTYFILLTSFGDKEHFVEGMNAGADDYHTKPIDLDELQARLVSAGRVVSLYRKLAESNKALRRDSATSFKRARVDPLTGIGNRLQMNEDLDVLWSSIKRYGHRVCVAMCDVDEFKQYNDRFGHLAGDEALRRVARTIRRSLRQGDSLYRFGGEEFVVILPEQSLTQARCAMNRVRRDVEKLRLGDSEGVTISVGIAAADASRDASFDEWLKRADEALYAAKAHGRNRIEPAEAEPVDALATSS